MNYKIRPHTSLTTKDKPFWQKALVVLTNMSTLWECRVCRQRRPHHPTKGHRLDEAETNLCTSCDEHIKMRKKQAKAIRIAKENAAREISEKTHWSYGEAMQRLDRH